MTEVDQVVVTTFATLFAAFGGVWAAFQFELSRRKQEAVDRNIAAVNRGLYTIFNLWDILTQYRIESIDPVRDKDHNWFKMRADFTVD